MSFSFFGGYNTYYYETYTYTEIEPVIYELNLEVGKQDYVVEGGNLYFKTSPEDLSSTKVAKWIQVLAQVLSYRVNIHIETVIPDTESTEILYNGQIIDIGPSIGSSSFEYILDTTSNGLTKSDLAKDALAQATSYLISDYFSVHTLAIEMSQSQVEKEYTSEITRFSTLMTSVILLPLVLLTAGSVAALTGSSWGVLNTVLFTLVTYTASIPIQIIAEEWEELYLDPLIEMFILRWLVQSGVSREVAEYWAMFACSFREALIGAGSTIVGSFTGGSSGANIDTVFETQVDSAMDISVDVFSTITEEIEISNIIGQESSLDYGIDPGYDLVQLMDAYSLEEVAGVESSITTASNARKRESFKSLITAKRFLSILFSIPSYFVGGGGLATTSHVLDLSTEVLFDMELKRLFNNRIVMDPFLDQLGKKHDLMIDQNLAFQERLAGIQNIPVIPAVKPLIPLQVQSLIDQQRLQAQTQDAIVITEAKQRELIIFGESSLDILSRTESITQEIVNKLLSGGDKLSIDATNLEAAVTADPRFKLVGKKYKIGELRLDLDISYNFEDADMWLKYKFRLAPNAELRYYINGRWITLNDIKSETIKIHGTDGKDHIITPDTTFAEVIEWVGYSLSDHIYIAESDASKKQIANDIAKSKWRFWYAQDSSYEITDQEAHIKDAYPGYWEIKRMWSYMFAGEFNFIQMLHTEEDIKVLDDLFSQLIYPTTSKFLSDNGFISKTSIDLDKFADEFKQGYYVRKFLTNDIISKIATSNDPRENIRRLSAWSKIIDATWEADFAPAFASDQADNVRYWVTERFGMAMLDLVMRGIIMIDSTTTEGGPEVHEVVNNLETFLSNKDLVEAVSKFFLGPNGRVAFFDMFSEAFKDNPQAKTLNIVKNINSIVGRTQEVNDYFNDLPSRYADEYAKFLITHNPSEITTFIEELRKKGANPFITGVNIGNGDVLDGNLLLGDLSTIEKKMFGFDIGVISRASGSDRRFFDNFIAILFDSYLASPNKGTSDLGSTSLLKSRMKGMSNDWGSGQVFTMLVELAKTNAKISDIKPYKVTLAMPSTNPNSDFQGIMNQLGMRHELNDLRNTNLGKDLKAPSKYAYLFEVAKMLNEEVIGNTRSYKEADTKVRDYFTNNRNKALRRLEKLADSVYTSKNDPDFFAATIDLFLDEGSMFLWTVLQRDIATGYYKVLLDNSFEILFDKNTDGSSKAFTLSDLPSTIKVRVNGGWLSKTELQNINYEFVVAYKVVHYVDGQNVKNGLVPIENIESNILFDGLNIVYEDGYYHEDAKGGKHVFRNIYVCDSKGTYLYSRVELKDQAFTIRSSDWYKAFTLSLVSRQDSSFYIAINIQSGKHQLNFLQKTIPQLSIGKEFKRYLPSLGYKAVKRGVLSSTRVQFQGVISDITLKKIGNIGSVISQMYNIYTPNAKAISTASLIHELSFSPIDIPEGFLGASSNNPYSPNGERYSLTQFNNVLNALNPTDIQIDGISQFTDNGFGGLKFNKLNSKKFYITMLELLQNSNDPSFLEYKKKLAGRTLTNLEICTTEEYQTIIDLDLILSEIFSYEGLTMLQLGMLSIQRSSTGLFVQPLGFHISYMQDIANQFGFRPANSVMSPKYIIDRKDSLADFLTSAIVSGNYKIFKVKDSKGNIKIEKLYNYPGHVILSSVIQNFQGNNQDAQYNGHIRSWFRNTFFSSIESPSSSSYKVTTSKQNLFSIYAGLIDTQITSQMLQNWVHLNPKFATDTDIWVEMIQRYLKIQFRESIMRARKDHDPIQLSRYLIMQKYATIPYATIPQSSLRLSTSHGGNGFYQQASLNIEANELYSELFNIQYSLQYTYARILKIDSRNQLIDPIFPEVERNIVHTYNNLYNILNEYSQIDDDRTFTAFFYREKAAGLPHSRSSIKESVYRSQSTSFEQNPEIQGTKFEFKLLKNDKSNLEEFTKALSSIVYYMVKYDSLVMIKEGEKGDTTAKYALIASLQELYDSSYIRALTDRTLQASLSAFAQSRLNVWKTGHISQGFWLNGWNRDHSGNGYWKDSNTYSFYMFDDAEMFSSKIARLFGVRYINGDPMSGIHILI